MRDYKPINHVYNSVSRTVRQEHRPDTVNFSNNKTEAAKGRLNKPYKLSISHYS